ncbi:MAG: nucleoside triphosphate pyrophosphohydrolase [Deltaproteobacteria bacterium]|nr:nucleoside triphosphate pyrophosphohydrolase [Deltaproteobacteria bacterium]
MKKKAEIEKLIALMERLRGDNGCPWDREQTLKTLVPFIIEEAYEVIAAIDEGSDESILEELGDLLFQIIFICQIKKEDKRFGLAEVIDRSHEKMVRRHPHVFGNAKADTPDEVLAHWAEIKKEEKKARKSLSTLSAMTGGLSDVPDALPALLRAHKVSQKAAKAGFDWKETRDVLEKLREEVEEFCAATEKNDKTNMEEELGDILFTLVNVSRFIEVNPEDALRKTIGKFIGRFHLMEKAIEKKGGSISTTRMEELEEAWQESKKLE